MKITKKNISIRRRNNIIQLHRFNSTRYFHYENGYWSKRDIFQHIYPTNDRHMFWFWK